MTERSDIVVVGAGVAGLVAAAQAAASGRRVTVLDAHPIGGRARSSQQRGFTLNHGGHALYRAGAFRRELLTPRHRSSRPITVDRRRSGCPRRRAVPAADRCHLVAENRRPRDAGAGCGGAAAHPPAPPRSGRFGRSLSARLARRSARRRGGDRRAARAAVVVHGCSGALRCGRCDRPAPAGAPRCLLCRRRLADARRRAANRGARQRR